MKKGIIILGSSKSFGDTRKLADYVSEKTNFPLIDLRTKNIGEFDYEYKNQDDDYIPLMKDITANYDLIVFATPVYWYNMSARMKIFFDRFSDLLHAEKELGRKLRGMEMAVISCASEPRTKEGFHMPFKESAKYLGMQYVGDVHGWMENGTLPEAVMNRLDKFIEQL